MFSDDCFTKQLWAGWNEALTTLTQANMLTDGGKKKKKRQHWDEDCSERFKNLFLVDLLHFQFKDVRIEE